MMIFPLKKKIMFSLKNKYSAINEAWLALETERFPSILSSTMSCLELEISFLVTQGLLK